MKKTFFRVGLAEDQPHILKGLLEHIDWSYNNIEVCFAVEDGNLAMERMLEDPPDVLITDIRMPGKSGLDLANYIHENHLETKVIILSAYDDFAYAQDAIQNNVFDYLLKPVEYSCVIETCRAALEEKEQEDKIRYQIRKSLPGLREKFLVDLVEGNLSEEEIVEQAAFLGVKLEYESFQCGIVSVKTPALSDAAYQMTENEMIMYRLKQRLQEVAAEETLYLFRLRSKALAFLAGFSAEAEQEYSRLNGTLEQILEEFQHKNDVSVTVACGRPVKIIEKIPVSFREALLVEDYRFRFSSGMIYEYAKLPLSSVNTDMLPFDLQDQMLKWVFLGDWNEVSKYLNKLYDYFTNCAISRTFICTFYLNVALRLHFQAALGNLSVPQKHNFTEEIASFMENTWNLSQVSEWLAKQCEMICDVVRDSYDHQYQLLVQQVNDYITAHYTEQDISLEKIAKHIGMNHSYLSSTYKKNAGKGINEAIMEKRMAASRKLLRMSDKLVQDIAEEVGFSNQYYFSAWFKKQAGCTPNEYRLKR